MTFLNQTLKSNGLLDYIYFEKPAKGSKGRNPENAMLAACKVVVGAREGKKVKNYNGDKVTLSKKEEISKDPRFYVAINFYIKNKSKEPYKLLDEMYKKFKKDRNARHELFRNDLLPDVCEIFDKFISKTKNFEYDKKKQLSSKIGTKVSKEKFFERLEVFRFFKHKNNKNFCFLPQINKSHRHYGDEYRYGRLLYKKEISSALKSIIRKEDGNLTEEDFKNIRKLISEYNGYVRNVSDTAMKEKFKKKPLKISIDFQNIGAKITKEALESNKYYKAMLSYAANTDFTYKVEFDLKQN